MGWCDLGTTQRAPRPAARGDLRGGRGGRGGRKDGPVAAAVVEALEPRRLLCFDGHAPGDSTDILVVPKTDGFQTSSTLLELAAAAAAPGMPDLHSRPSAPVAIYMDFDGDTTTATNPYSEDADGATFNTAEAESITEAWRQLSSFFAIFDVNVTTTPPTVPTAWLAIGNNISGGYSYVNVFPNTYPRSFNQSSDARGRVSGLAHEIGHNFGLHHQANFDLLGNLTAEYSSGPDLLHGPLMGVDYAQNVKKWSIGHPSNSASALQHDLTVIANDIKSRQPAGGDGFRIDDFADTIAAATTLTLDGATQSVEGIIERHTDVDAFRFTVASDAAPTHVSAIARGMSAVDLKLTLYNSFGSLIAVRDAAASNGQDLALTLASGTYYAMLSSHGNYGDVGEYALSVNPLPAGWAAGEIGATPPGGWVTFDPGASVYSIGARGGHGTNADQLRFAYQVLDGNGSITARIDAVDSSLSTARAGVMIRDSLASNSSFAYLAMGGSSQLYLASRGATGGSASVSNTGTFSRPYWVRLERSGSTVTAWRSANGATWSAAGTRSVAMGTTVYIGLFGVGNVNNTFATASLSNVTLTGALGAPPPIYNALPAPVGVTVGTGTGTGLNVNWNDVDGESGFVIERSEDGVNFVTVGTVAAGITSYSNPALNGSMRYFYRVSATDAGGMRSAPSAIVSAVNRPSAVGNLTITSLNTTQLVLNWRDTSGESGYRIERSSDGGGSWSLLTTLAANIPSYHSTGLTQGITYTYRVTPTSPIGDGPSATAVRQTRLNAVNGLAVTDATPNAIRIEWNGVAHASSYRVERSTNGTSFSTLVTLNGEVGTYLDSSVTPLNKYFYRVIALNLNTQSVNSSLVAKAATPAASLPAGWATVDIGATEYNAAGFNGSTATILSAGNIGGSSDAFHFLFRQFTGDGEIIARLISRDADPAGSKVGLMIRESLSASARHVFVRYTDGAVGMEHRGGSTAPADTSRGLPTWLKLTRTSGVITGAWSNNGSSWTILGSITVSGLGANAMIGIAGAAGNSVSIVRAAFDSIAGSAVTEPDDVPPPTPTLISISSDTGASAFDRLTTDGTLIFNGTAEPTAQVRIARTGVGVVGTVQAGTSGAWSFDYTGVTLSPGAHEFTAVAIDPWDNASGPLVIPITIDQAGPAVTAWGLDDVAQRALFTFSEAMNPAMSGAAVQLMNLSTGQARSVSFASYDALTRTAGFGYSTLPDGHYSATLRANSSYDRAGNLNADAFTFYFLIATGTGSADVLHLRRSADGTSVEAIRNGIATSAPLATLGKIILHAGAAAGDADEIFLDFANGDLFVPQGVAMRDHETLRIAGATGSGSGGAGEPFVVASDSITRTGPAPAVIDFPATVAALALETGSFSVTGDLAGRSLDIGAAASATFAASQQLAALHVAGAASVTSGADRLLRLGALEIASGGTLDLADNDLVIDYASVSPVGIWTGDAYDGVSGLIQSGRLITSAGPAALTALAATEARDALGIAGAQTGTFAGQAVDSTSVLVKFTWSGDANLDGKINIDDYGRIDSMIGQSGSVWGWFNGDFNYDGKINIDDYGIIDSTIAQQDGTL